MKSKKPLLLALAVSLLAGGFFLYRSFRKVEIVYAGNIDCTRVDLPARLPTVVSKILVQEGDVVEKSQLLAELSCEDLRVALKLVQRNFQRSQQLFKAGNISQEAYDLAANKHDEIQTKLAWCEIKSPISGIVLTKYLEPGEWANPGTKVLSVADLDDIYAWAYVAQETMAHLKVGQKVTGQIPELGDQAFEGTIRKINEEAEFTPKNVQTRSERTRLVYGIKVSLPNRERQLKPGMTIELEL